MNTLTEIERTQMIEAVTGALKHQYRYGNQHGSSDAEVDGVVVLTIDTVEDVLGASWADGLGASEYELIGTRYYHVENAAVDAALDMGATWWVDEYGADALAEAREQDTEIACQAPALLTSCEVGSGEPGTA